MVVSMGLPGVGGGLPRRLFAYQPAPGIDLDVADALHPSQRIVVLLSSPALPTIEPRPAPGYRLAARSCSVTSET